MQGVLPNDDDNANYLDDADETGRAVLPRIVEYVMDPEAANDMYGPESYLQRRAQEEWDEDDMIPGEVCCSVLQCVAVCLSGVQWGAVGCSGLQRRVLRVSDEDDLRVHLGKMYCCVLQCVAVCYSVLQYVAGVCGAARRKSGIIPTLFLLSCVAVCCSGLLCVAVRCSALQRVAVSCSWVVVSCIAIAVCCSRLQSVAVSCTELQHHVQEELDEDDMISGKLWYSELQ